MTTISPNRDAVDRALQQVRAQTRVSILNGTPEYAADATYALIEAAMRQFADMADKGLKMADILAALELAFANAIASSVGTTAKSSHMRPEVIVTDFTVALLERVIAILHKEPTVSERVQNPRGGSA